MSASRSVVVVSPCTAPETYCASTCSCSQQQICLPVASLCPAATTSAGGVATSTPAPPVIVAKLSGSSLYAETTNGTKLVLTTVAVGEALPQPRHEQALLSCTG